jgi:hypothetical protein
MHDFGCDVEQEREVDFEITAAAMRAVGVGEVDLQEVLWSAVELL